MDHPRSRVWDHPGQHGENSKISWAWWRVPVIPVTWETEAGESLKPRRQRLQWAEMVPLHSSLGNRAKKPPSQNNNSNNTDDDEAHGRMCVGPMQVLHHFASETWASTDFGIGQVSWNQSPVDTEEWLYMEFSEPSLQLFCKSETILKLKSTSKKSDTSKSKQS